MKNILLTGTNGMIGGLVLQECLNSPEVRKVISITRKPLGISHPKLTEIIHNNFLDYTAVESQFKNIDVCFYCIGVYTGQVPTQEFKKITVDFTKAFCETLKRNSPQTSICFLSGQGADGSEKSKVLFAREKGIAENFILSLQFQHTYIFRPGYIYPVTPRIEPNMAYKIMRLLYKPVSAIYPNIGVTSVQLAHKIFTTGLRGGDRIIYENKFIRS
jgi:nucleoside-diphosphate-sugar epimerase